METLFFVLTILVVEVSLIVLALFLLYLYRNFHGTEVLQPIVQENVYRNAVNPEVLSFGRKLHAEIEGIMKKYDDACVRYQYSKPINQKQSNAPLLIKFYNNFYNYLLSECAAVDSGLLSSENLSLREGDVAAIIAEFNQLEAGIITSEEQSEEEIRKMTERLSSLEKDAQESLSYYADLKQENVTVKKNNRQLSNDLSAGNKQIAELMIEVTKLKKEADLFSKSITTKEADIQEFKVPVVDNNSSSESKDQVEELQRQLQEQLDQEKEKYQKKLEQISEENNRKDDDRDSLERELVRVKAENEDLHKTCAGDQELISELQQDQKDLKKIIDETNERIVDLEAYKSRFTELHKQINTETGANRDFRKGVKEKAVGSECEDEIDFLIKEYEEVREDLDDFLERPDIAPLSPVVAEVNDDFITSATEDLDQLDIGADIRNEANQLSESNSQQVGMISSLKDQLNEVTLDRDRLIGELINLEGKVLESGDIIADMEKQINDSEATIEALKKKIVAISGKGMEIKQLEQTIERFSRQSMDMMQQLTDLEEENIRLKEQMQ
ncbi:MAG: hypothetical protein D6B27_06855 [Gammaproteobacteria bacterium]|nr:MAG: hypothetical protein D6B27_06855 [Gammaproteobacteria bacterium]